MYGEEPYYDGTQLADNTKPVNVTLQVSWNTKAMLEGVVAKVSQMIYDDIHPQVEKAVTKTLEDAVNRALMEVLEREIQPTDKWGEAIGEAITIRDKLQQEAEAWLTQKVDSYGRHGSNSYGQKLPRIHWLFEEALQGEKNRNGDTSLARLVKKTVKHAVGDIEELVTSEVQEQVRSRLTQVLKE